MRELLELQSGVVARRQLLGKVGAGKHDLDRMVRRRELTAVLPGVYVDHTGPLSWHQRAWAAVLHAGPGAALCLESAWAADGSAGAPLPGDAVVHVAVEAARRLADQPGVRVHRVVGLAAQVQENASPPRVRTEATALELAHRAPTRLDAVRVLTDAVGGRRTTAARLRTALAARSRTRDRAFLTRLLDDLERGTCSVLEHGFLTRVERAHGLPEGRRQRPRRAEGREYRDVEYVAFGLVVELDGRAGHTGWDATGRDADRDLDDHADGREAVRLRWRQVYGTECRTAARLARILQRRGWTGAPVACGPDCAVAALDRPAA
nr:hypothetical protein [Nocardioides luti]